MAKAKSVCAGATPDVGISKSGHSRPACNACVHSAHMRSTTPSQYGGGPGVHGMVLYASSSSSSSPQPTTTTEQPAVLIGVHSGVPYSSSTKKGTYLDTVLLPVMGVAEPVGIGRTAESNIGTYI